jgi:GH25 family lysozyme M1 (1,4-beta-N-acetylmuramidase)
MEEFIDKILLLIKLYPNKSFFALVGLTCLALVWLIYLLRKKSRKRKNIVFALKVVSFLLFASFMTGTAMLYLRNYELKMKRANVMEDLSIHANDYTFGIDVSHYNGNIDWSLVSKSSHPIKFVFVRSTMGKNGVDKRYEKNLNEAERQGLIVGTYHYYRPNENSLEQFNHFKKHAIIKKGHLLPVLDIEETSRFGEENLRKGIKNWLDLAEREYGVKPILYSGRVFYRQHLKGYFDDYPLWVASYAPKSKLKGIDWDFHQFSERVNVKGIDGYVDGNDFQGALDQMKEFCINH